MAVPDPDLEIEASLFDGGARLVAGIDEVGRGAWAGPVSVGVVVLAAEMPPAPAGIRDSKLLSAKKRIALAPAIVSWAVASAVGSASNHECDQLGMRGAVALACSRALDGLDCEVDAVIVDGPIDLLSGGGPGFSELVAAHAWRRHPPRVEAVVKADQRCLSAAAASVVAKVTRDAEMARWAEEFPGYGFEKSVGYPAPIHREALERDGLTPLHRVSWSYVETMGLNPNGANARE
jgi:ribonuclease HII